MLYGDHGAYVELSPEHMLLESAWQPYSGKSSDYYDLLMTTGVGAGCVAYFQMRTVEDKPNPPAGRASSAHNREAGGYADYLVGMYYISVHKIECRSCPQQGEEGNGGGGVDDDGEGGGGGGE